MEKGCDENERRKDLMYSQEDFVHLLADREDRKWPHEYSCESGNDAPVPVWELCLRIVIASVDKVGEQQDGVHDRLVDASICNPPM